MLTPTGLTNILENYAQIIEEKDSKDRKEKAHPDLAALPPACRGATGP